ncbi:MAG: hypothetical protein QM758_07660 [Armatimonas sp.]
MSHLHRSIEQVLATRTNAYLVAMAALVVTGAPIFTREKEAPAGYLSAPVVFALMRPLGARKGEAFPTLQVQPAPEYSLPFSAGAAKWETSKKPFFSPSVMRLAQ